MYIVWTVKSSSMTKNITITHCRPDPHHCEEETQNTSSHKTTGRQLKQSNGWTSSIVCAGAILTDRPVCYGTSRLKSQVCAVLIIVLKFSKYFTWFQISICFHQSCLAWESNKNRQLTHPIFSSSEPKTQFQGHRAFVLIGCLSKIASTWHLKYWLDFDQTWQERSLYCPVQ